MPNLKHLLKLIDPRKKQELLFVKTFHCVLLYATPRKLLKKEEERGEAHWFMERFLFFAKMLLTQSSTHLKYSVTFMSFKPRARSKDMPHLLKSLHLHTIVKSDLKGLLMLTLRKISSSFAVCGPK